ncbi:MAG: hypothetical protein HC836_26245 [Richelia sp. RM2_1_2]|nr:hypothetical protein [Richelia sp. RM2_1_2]
MPASMVAGGRLQSIKFFRTRLIFLNPEESEQFLLKLKKDSNDLIKSIYEICSYSKNITRDDAWVLSSKEREIMFSIIKEKFQTIEKTNARVNLF